MSSSLTAYEGFIPSEISRREVSGSSSINITCLFAETGFYHWHNTSVFGAPLLAVVVYVYTDANFSPRLAAVAISCTNLK